MEMEKCESWKEDEKLPGSGNRKSEIYDLKRERKGKGKGFDIYVFARLTNWGFLLVFL